MKNIIFFAALLCAALTATGLSAQSVNDESEIQAFTRGFMAAYNAQDQAALQKMYTDDAVRIDLQGNPTKGAANIGAYFAGQFVKNNTTLLLKHTGINWSDAEHAWVARGNFEVYGKTNVYDIPIDIVGSYANAMQKTNGAWKIARSVLSPPDMEGIKAEIQALNDTWSAASNAKDIATIMEFYADDAVSMSDDKPATASKAAIKKAIEADLAKRKEGNKVTYETTEVFGGGQFVTEVGKTTVKDASGKVVYTGKYMELWEKRKGQWQVIREIYNDDAKEEPAK